jgi:hypothetical protein
MHDSVGKEALTLWIMDQRDFSYERAKGLTGV